jgi:ATP-dependent Clp protease ATP-binding subunit ClpC
MFERFSPAARQVVVNAQAEARALEQDHIGSQHLLHALLRDEDGVAAVALASRGLTIEDVRGQVARIGGHAGDVAHRQLPFTPRAKKTLEQALRAAIALRHRIIEPEHLLLGLVREAREQDDVRALESWDVSAEDMDFLFDLLFADQES